MPLLTLGLNHHGAPVAVRERVAFAPDRMGLALGELTQHHLAREAVILSTCNRTEIYCATEQPEQVLAWLAQHHGLAREELAPYLFSLTGAEAIRHAFRVACGLDSMVIGEPQILGQMKDAVRSAEEAGTVGSLLSKLFQRSFAVAKDVRTRTAIGANIVSMAAAAVHLAERIFDDISRQKLLFIGAGEMIELCAAHFAARQPKTVTVANRTIERGQVLAERMGGAAVKLDALSDIFSEFDIVISCTASPLPIIGLGMVERAIRARRHRPIFMVDLAVPRDIEPEVGELDDVFLYTVDDLSQVVASGKEARQAAVSEAEMLVTEQVKDFERWLESRGAVPTIRALRDSVDRMRRHELDHAMKLLARGDSPPAVLEALSQRLTNKFLHAPLKTLGQVEGDQREVLHASVAQLFHLHPED